MRVNLIVTERKVRTNYISVKLLQNSLNSLFSLGKINCFEQTIPVVYASLEKSLVQFTNCVLRCFLPVYFSNDKNSFDLS